MAWLSRLMHTYDAEATGAFSIYKTSDLPKDVEPEVLLAVPAYKALVEAIESGDRDRSDKAKSQANKGDVPSGVKGNQDGSYRALRGQAEKFRYSHEQHGSQPYTSQSAEGQSSPSEEQSSGAETAVEEHREAAEDDNAGAAESKPERQEPQRRRTGQDGQGRTAVGTDQENEIAQRAS